MSKSTVSSIHAAALSEMQGLHGFIPKNRYEYADLAKSIETELEAATLRVKTACSDLGRSEGHCRDASLILIEFILFSGLVFTAFLSIGKFNESNHFWVRLPLNGNFWILDPTSDQFGSPYGLMVLEEHAPAYHEEKFVIFDERNLTPFRKLLNL